MTNENGADGRMRATIIIIIMILMTVKLSLIGARER